MVAALGAALAGPVAAQRASDDHAVHHESAQTAPLAEGEIRKVDREAKKLTIRHGPIPSLDMPAMTMVFQVTDPAILGLVKQGDKVRFEALKLGGAFTVTRIETLK